MASSSPVAKPPVTHDSGVVTALQNLASSGITADRVLKAYADIAFADARDLFDPTTGRLFDNPHDFPDHLAQAISSIEVDAKGRQTVKLESRKAALDSLANSIGLDRAQLLAQPIDIDLSTEQGAFNSVQSIVMAMASGRMAIKDGEALTRIIGGMLDLQARTQITEMKARIDELREAIKKGTTGGGGITIEAEDTVAEHIPKWGRFKDRRREKPPPLLAGLDDANPFEGTLVEMEAKTVDKVVDPFAPPPKEVDPFS